MESSRRPLFGRKRSSEGEEDAPGEAFEEEQGSAPPPGAGPPAVVPASGRSGAVGDAASRIQEIIDTAERVAEDIRAEAQAEAERYLDEERSRAAGLHDSHADLLTELAGDLAGQADGLRAQIDRAVQTLESAAGRIRDASAERPEVPSEREQDPTPVPPPIPQPVAYGGTGASSPPPTYESAIEEPAGEEAAGDPETADPEATGPAALGGEEAIESVAVEESISPEEAPPAEPATEEEALLRATQMAVAGSSRDEIAATLQNELGVGDPDPILDQILGPGR